MVKVLFVCMGNICRSPTAEGVFRQLIEEQGLADHITIDSAGTCAFHVGEMPDPRARESALRRGVDLSDIRARAFSKEDFSDFDIVLAMDQRNLNSMKDMMPDNCPSEVRLFLEFSSRQEAEVPDPYYGGPQGFEFVLDLIEDASNGLLEHIRKNYMQCAD